MIKKTSKSMPINLLTAFIVLLSFLLVSIGVSNAWFESGQYNNIFVVMRVGELKIDLYQKIGESSIKIAANEENSLSASPSYIQLQEEIAPNEFVTLNLQAKNSDVGEGVYLRYKFQLFACGVSSDTQIPVTVSTSTNFVQNGDYFCYNNGSSFISFNSGDTVPLMTGFTIQESDFMELNGSETVKIIFTLECVPASVGFNV